MKRTFPLLIVLSVWLTGCADYGNFFFVRHEDPFTRQVSSYTVDDYSPESVPSVIQARPEGSRRIIPNHVTVSKTEGRPYMLQIIRNYREQYDMPDSARVLVRLENGQILDMPVMRGWYTLNGVLQVQAELTPGHLDLLSKHPIAYIRINPIRINEEPLAPYNVEYWPARARRFNQALRMMLSVK